MHEPFERPSRISSPPERLWSIGAQALGVAPAPAATTHAIGAGAGGFKHSASFSATTARR